LVCNVAVRAENWLFGKQNLCQNKIQLEISWKGCFLCLLKIFVSGSGHQADNTGKDWPAGEEAGLPDCGSVNDLSTRISLPAE
jgi:hypothetical protein